MKYGKFCLCLRIYTSVCACFVPTRSSISLARLDISMCIFHSACFVGGRGERRWLESQRSTTSSSNWIFSSPNLTIDEWCDSVTFGRGLGFEKKRREREEKRKWGLQGLSPIEDRNYVTPWKGCSMAPELPLRSSARARALTFNSSVDRNGAREIYVPVASLEAAILAQGYRYRRARRKKRSTTFVATIS